MTGYVHLYDKEDRLWTVGYWKPPEDNTVGPRFTAIRDCGSIEEAAAFINYLNGGRGEKFDWR